jgi:D-serine deaminase-like pyridoxal phosphate-dependent protein
VPDRSPNNVNSIDYKIRDTSGIITPALCVFKKAVESNIRRMIAMAGDAGRLRPHCKTHKMPAVVGLLQEYGITKHKAATFAEAEMLAEAGARDILLAYNIVGPNIERSVEFAQRYPSVTFSVTADHAMPIRSLSAAMGKAELTIDVLLDLDTGQHRTGIAIGDDAFELYRLLCELPGLKPGGFHVYDGHQHQESLTERSTAVLQEWQQVIGFRDRCVAAGLSVPRIVAGGTVSFPVYAELDEPSLECSPGTCIFHDTGYGGRYQDLDFTPAAVLLTRVISRPTSDRVTLDLGYKAVASDPPDGKRLTFPALPDARQVLQNEEHLVLQTDQAHRFVPGDELIAIPTHVCPTSALHRQAYVIEDGRLVDHWDVTARDRKLTI